MNLIRPPSTELLQFLTGYVTLRCDPDLWPFDLGVRSRDATWVVNQCTKFEHDMTRVWFWVWRTVAQNTRCDARMLFVTSYKTGVIGVAESLARRDHWAKVANKTANTNIQNRSLYAIAASLHIKNWKYQKNVILLSTQQYIDTKAMSCCVISHFLIFAVFDV